MKTTESWSDRCGYCGKEDYSERFRYVDVLGCSICKPCAKWLADELEKILAEMKGRSVK